uniref:LIM zinc-binding domain-containing protein n=1 Tax=Trichobilharzia regenti TaxID=157069 RepID=A0AA85KJE1_TRIRE|nr:unnamed protein product [Trichobilharzia regenti]
MVKVYCTVCHKRCKGDVLKIEQQFIHYKCFQCIKCRKNLKQGGFFVKDKKFYCPNDYQSEFGVRCETCHGYVEGERTTILDGLYYCMPCSTNLTNGGGGGSLAHTSNTIGRGGASGTSIVAASVTPGTGTTNGSRFNPLSLLSSSRHSHTMPSIKTSTSSPSHNINNNNNNNNNNNSNTIDNHYSPYSHQKQSKRFIANNNVNGNNNNTNLKSFTSLNDQLSVQIHENGGSIPDSEYNKRKLEVQGIEPVTIDTLLSTTPGQTISPNSFTPSTTCERRICPPGVDYGRHYPISYLQLAEQGFTAIMSNDELNPNMNGNAGGGGGHRSRSLARSFFSPMHSASSTGSSHHPHSHLQHPQQQHVSRRDVVVRSMTSNSIPYRRSNDLDSKKQMVNGGSPNRYNNNNNNSNIPLATTATTMTSISHDSNMPISLTGRPKRDMYVRQRQLSPGSTSLGSGVMGYRRSERMMNSSTLPPGLENLRQSTGRYSCRSTPNVTGKRGMTQLAESLVRPRVDRTASPPSAALYWSEARRLASYPNARLPDSNSLPAIERYDFPAPPSPAVVMIDKRREKRMTGVQSVGLDSRDGTLRNGTMTSVDTDWTDRDPAVNAKLDRIDAEIETLKRLGESSGITAALIQELEASKSQIHEVDLDPISASRSPNANVEPGYKTRYKRHGYTSPSRDTRRDRRGGHSLSYRLEYSSTGGRSGTIPSFPSRYDHDYPMRQHGQYMRSTYSAPRPGYTSSILYGRAVSLPRPFMGVENGDGILDHNSTLSGHIHTGGSSSGVRGSASTTLRTAQSGHSFHPGTGGVGVSHSAYSGDVLNCPDRTITVPESLNTNFSGTESRTIGLQDGIGSVTTSGLSMDGLIAESGDDITLTSPHNGYFMKSGTLAGLPCSVTGLRPVGLPSYHHYSHHAKSYSTSRRGRTSTPVPTSGSGGGAGGVGSGLGYLTDPDLMDIDAYPSVQSWLRPTASSVSRHEKSFKIYPYEVLKASSNQPLKGVDRTQLECHLSADEFEQLFKMSPQAFQRLPEWKRNDLKKKLDLL